MSRNTSPTFSAGARCAVLALGSVSALSQVHAYLPLRYSPLDAYVQGAVGRGPTKVTVRQGSKIVATAQLSYDASGRLSKETYEGATGAAGGTTTYVYQAKRLVREETRNAKGTLTNVKEFSYAAGGLDLMRVRDPAGAVLIEQRFTSRDGRILQAKQVTGGEESFRLEYKGERPVLLRVMREDGKEIGRITYRYGSRGQVEERLRIQGDRTERCRYIYDSRGRLLAYVYEEPEKKGWKEVRRIEFSY